ncbi:MAG TPA: response regulator [Herpetosiphonaceae bacterium]
MERRHAILVIEDDDHFRQTLIWALEARQWPVLAAASGAEALALLGRYAPPLGAILLDATLPDMAAADMCRELERARPGLPVIMMSGDPLSLIRERAAVNPRRFLAKPFDLAALYRELSASVSS